MHQQAPDYESRLVIQHTNFIQRFDTTQALTGLYLIPKLPSSTPRMRFSLTHPHEHTSWAAV